MGERAPRQRANGDGSIIERTVNGTTRYIAAISLDRGKRRITRTCATRAEARKELKKLLAERDAGRLDAGGRQTVKTYLRDWVENVKAHEVGQTSLTAYRIRTGHIVHHLGSVRLAELTAQAVRQFYATLIESGMSPNTVQAVHGTFSAAMNHAVADGMLTMSPLKTVRPPRRESAPMLILTRDQVETLLGGTRDYPDHALLVLLVTTGMRIGEALALHWDSVALDRREVSIAFTLGHLQGGAFDRHEPKTPSSRRVVHLPEMTVTAMRHHYATQRAAMLTPIVFPNSYGSYQQNRVVFSRLEAHCERLSLPPIRIHDLRHTYVTHALRLPGANIKDVADAVGHATPATTLAVYAHTLDAARRQMSEDIGRFFDPTGVFTDDDGPERESWHG